MNTPNFHSRDIFSESEKIFLRGMVKHLDEACHECDKCEECIFSRFCDKGASPAEKLDEIISILGVSKD